ncbi:hypothetical protein TW85_13150, partial [Marinomonas sp. S3726]
MMTWKHIFGASFIAIVCHALILALILRPTTQGAQAAGDVGVLIDIGMQGDLGESEITSLAKAETKQIEPLLKPEPQPVIEPQPVVESPVKANITPPIENDIPSVSEQIQIAQVEVKPEPEPEPEP